MSNLGQARPVPDSGAPLVVFGSGAISLESLVALAAGSARAQLVESDKLAESVASLERQLARGDSIYGVTTGFGDSCVHAVTDHGVLEMPHNLVRFHGCGTGRVLGEVEAASVVVARLASLVRGYSAVRAELLVTMATLLNQGVLPAIPEEGSVGASGDLTPLSYLASLLMGESEALFRGMRVPASFALTEVDVSPLQLGPKEGLALMNGTSMMTGLGCLAFARAARLARLAAALTAMLSDVVGANRSHFHQRIFELKPHPGQGLVAKWIREDIEYTGAPEPSRWRLQDRYSIRCAPHAIGVLADALLSFRPTLEIELNSVNDNPIILADEDCALHGGNFYGGHVCYVMDALKAAVASVADLMDRQMVMLCNPATNHGLPGDLVGAEPAKRPQHHGFKAMQITTSALAAEALKLTMPASSFSRSTESHNQDKVSMGTIAARDCLRVLELSERVGVILLLAACQAVDLREKEGCHQRSLELHAAVRRLASFNALDRRQDGDIAGVHECLRSGGLPIGEFDALFRVAVGKGAF